MNIFQGLKLLRTRFGVTMVRDTGSARMTIALRGRPFARLPDTAPLAASIGGLQGIKLNVGGGKGHPKVLGWTIVDLRETADLQLDLTRERLPFDDGSVAIIFTSHMLEHIYPRHLDFILGEFYRTLRAPDGLLRIAVPDIALAIKAYAEQREQFFYDGDVGLEERNIPIAGLLASWLYSTRLFKDPDGHGGDGHVHCFDADYLMYRLRRVGFRKVWRSSYQSSVAKELRTDAFDRHPHDSLFVETSK